MAKIKNIQKVAQALNASFDSFSDGSQSWVTIEDHRYTVNICFDGKGEKFEHVTIAKKIYKQVDEVVITRVKNNPCTTS